MRGVAVRAGHGRMCVECVLEEPNPVGGGGGRAACRQVSHLLDCCWGLYKRSRVSLELGAGPSCTREVELGAGPSCLAGAEMGGGRAWVVPWSLGYGGWGSSAGRPDTMSMESAGIEGRAGHEEEEEVGGVGWCSTHP